MTFGRVNPQFRLEDQGIEGLGNVYYNLMEPALIEAALKRGEGTLGKLVNQDVLYAETTEAMKNLREIVQKINRGEGTVGMLVNDDSLFKSARATLQKVDNATETMEDQGPVSVIGLMFNGLF